MTANHMLDIPLQGRKAGAWTISALFAGESFMRALNVSVIPIQAYDLLGSSQKVSIVATAVSFCVLLTTLTLPFVFRGLRRRWVYSIGIGLVMAAAMIFAVHLVAGQVVASYFRNVGASVLNITLALYIMDNISKPDLTKVEPLRMTIATASWVAGPAIGTWLYANYGTVVPQVAVVLAGLLHLAGFWVFRLREPHMLQPGTLAGFNPLGNALDFFRQPRLRLAWAIAFGRSCFWSALFIYGPLLMLEGGLPKVTAGFIISASQLTLPLSFIFGHFARRNGVRLVVAFCFACLALCAATAGLLGTLHVELAVVCLLLAAVCASGLDGVGGVAFYRAVRARDRQRMTSVYRTFFECSELLPGFMFMGLLLFLKVGIVFIVIAVLSGFLSVITWKHLPKSM
jgi:MFS family permease